MFEKQSNLQVANYMNGGHYNPHHDYVMKEKNPEHVSCECDLINLIFPTLIEVASYLQSIAQLIYLPESSLYIGDRVATWMFYMSDVSNVVV